MTTSRLLAPVLLVREAQARQVQHERQRRGTDAEGRGGIRGGSEWSWLLLPDLVELAAATISRSS